MIIVIDGPAGSGKSSTAKAIAAKAGIHYLDSGAFYRSLAYIYNEKNCDKALFFDALKISDITFRFDNNTFRVFSGKEDLTEVIRSPEVSAKVSEVAAMPEAREFVNSRLREFVKKGDFIADGRDLGTVVFPEADFKFFLVADLKTRAQRRLSEMTEKGIEAELNSVEENLSSRDQQDSTRDVAPLRKADDAIEIDTSDISFEEQIKTIMRHCGLSYN